MLKNKQNFPLTKKKRRRLSKKTNKVKQKEILHQKMENGKNIVKTQKNTIFGERWSQEGRRLPKKTPKFNEKTPKEEKKWNLGCKKGKKEFWCHVEGRFSGGAVWPKNV